MSNKTSVPNLCKNRFSELKNYSDTDVKQPEINYTAQKNKEKTSSYIVFP